MQKKNHLIYNGIYNFIFFLCSGTVVVALNYQNGNIGSTDSETNTQIQTKSIVKCKVQR